MQQPAQRCLQKRKQRLDFRVTEAHVELDHLRAFAGQREPDVEHPLKRDAQAGQCRLDHLCHHGFHQIGWRPRQRRVGAHAAGVGPLVVVAHAFEVLRGHERDSRLPVADDEEGDLRPVEVLLDDDAAALDRVGAGRLEVVGDHDALARREPVVLHHVGRGEGDERIVHLRRW